MALAERAYETRSKREEESIRGFLLLAVSVPFGVSVSDKMV